MTQWDTGDPEYGDEKTTPTETEYGEIIEEPRTYIDNIRVFNKYIGVMVKLGDETNSGGNIATVKRCATNANGF